MASPLSTQRCLIHAYREAVARCPSCGHTFCRECITEHQDRILCANCLRAETGETAQKDPWWSGIALPLAACGGLAVTWFVFYYIGSVLLRIPANLHEGSYLQDFLP